MRKRASLLALHKLFKGKKKEKEEVTVGEEVAELTESKPKPETWIEFVPPSEIDLNRARRECAGQ